jgi:hypothetical protein
MKRLLTLVAVAAISAVCARAQELNPPPNAPMYFAGLTAPNFTDTAIQLWRLRRRIHCGRFRSRLVWTLQRGSAGRICHRSDRGCHRHLRHTIPCFQRYVCNCRRRQQHRPIACGWPQRGHGGDREQRPQLDSKVQLAFHRLVSVDNAGLSRCV